MFQALIGVDPDPAIYLFGDPDQDFDRNTSSESMFLMAKNIYLQMWFFPVDVKNGLPFGLKTADILFFFGNLYMPHCVTITKP